MHGQSRACVTSWREGGREGAGSYLRTHITDNQIIASIQYITDKLFIKQKAWIAA